ncbi:hypothetical protein IAR55_003586 [Kwoniella newhampshirensis]|uniref:Uncharacterized protein n=1 Tax=Kwoniella newhampshirensis TaxID=1651941 RepID=A0AAW0YZF9_9TREE
MTTPAALSFAGLSALTAVIFIIWHTWHYDKWRCLLFTKDDWFRAMMCHILVWSIILFFTYAWLSVHVAYTEYWVYIPQIDKTIVSPWQLWSQRNQDIWRGALYIMSVGWGLLQGVHLEEFLYWGYLMRSIQTPGGPKTSWLRSG